MILRSLDGEFYEIPDDHVSAYLIPADKIRARAQSNGNDDDSLAEHAAAVGSRPRNMRSMIWHNIWRNRA